MLVNHEPWPVLALTRIEQGYNQQASTVEHKTGSKYQICRELDKSLELEMNA